MYNNSNVCTQNFILCMASAESPSEKLKTAVLIVSLSWQEMGGFRGTVEPPIEEVIASGIVPRLVQIMDKTEDHKLKFEVNACLKLSILCYRN